MPKFGIDISVWQKGFNFDKAIAEGVEFAILRGAYHLSKDKCFEDFYAACKARNLPVGVYLYSMAKTVSEAKEEANNLIKNVLKGKRFEYPIYMDVEDKTQRALGKTLLTDIVVAFCETLENAGYYVGIYSSASFIRSYMEEDRLAPYDKWVAQWSKKCTYTGDYGLWQFGGETNLVRSNKIAGVVCDQDYAYKDYPAIIKEAGLNGFGEPETVKTKTVEELAQEVINGVWGNGAARKAALIKAGYNYDNVQAKVNELLSGKKPSKTVTEIAKEVIAGKWGNGADRKKRLKAAGYDYDAVQRRVNELLK